MKKTKKLAVCAVLAAFGVAILYVGSFMEILDLSVSLAASLIVLFCVEELGNKSALSVYAVISTLSFILLPQKWIAAYFVFFFGIMPITKNIYEKAGKVIGWGLKLLTFNLEAFGFYFVAKNLEFFAESESSLPYLLAMLALANGVFVLADVLYTKFCLIYRARFRTRIKRFLK
jgi:hypothetical protein